MLSLHLICQTKFTENESNNNKKNQQEQYLQGVLQHQGSFFPLLSHLISHYASCLKGRSINHIKQGKYLRAIPNRMKKKKKNPELQETATSKIYHRMKYVLLASGVKEKYFSNSAL